MKVLIVDDNKDIVALLREYALNESYTVVSAYDGEEALEKFKNENPDIILLDIMIPKIDGFEVCRKIRSESNIPIIMITARGEDFEKIMGLEIGADDYIVKPFSPAEVIARIKAIMRRLNGNDSSNNTISESNLNVNIDSYEVKIDNSEVMLTKKEVEILWLFLNNKNKVFTRDNLLESIWGYDYFGDIRTVDSHIKRLRAKLDKHNHENWEIKTIWGVGYKFEVKNDY